MARLRNLFTIVLLALLSVRLALSSDPPGTAPSPAPEIGADSLSPSPASPSPLPELSSPPAPPPPSDLALGSSYGWPSPAPAPSAPSDISNLGANAEEESSSGGLKGGQKAGIVFGVVAGACLVGLGGMVYRKRQQNIRRSQFGAAARSDFL